MLFFTVLIFFGVVINHLLLAVYSFSVKITQMGNCSNFVKLYINFWYPHMYIRKSISHSHISACTLD